MDRKKTEIEQGVLEKYAAQTAENYFHTPALRIRSLGGGFYGRVFLVESDTQPRFFVLKLYLFPGLASGEALQLTTLAAHGTLRMPQVYFVQEAETPEGFDVLCMEYLPGINAGNLSGIENEAADRIGEAIISNLLSYHSTLHEPGFGLLNAEHFARDFREYYRPIAEEICKKAEILHNQSELDLETVRIMNLAMEHFDRIFYLPITEARLIHGDYNTWNILLHEDLSGVSAVIDPFNCCYADSEYDLYQLDNANGTLFHLLTIYKKHQALTENFQWKRSFYELFTEISHYSDARITPYPDLVARQAGNVSATLKEIGL